MGRAADVSVAAEWRKRVDRWRRSGLSVAEFCRQEQISQPSFFHWRKRLAGQGVITARRRPQRVDRDRQARRFLQLPAGWPAIEGIEIALPGGAIVKLPVQIGIERLTAAIRAAMSAPAAEVRPC